MLDGGGGADTLIGGTGGDTLTGGTGIDHFVFLSSDTESNFRHDMITDFVAGSGERLDFSLMDANPYMPGIQPSRSSALRNFSAMARCASAP